MKPKRETLEHSQEINAPLVHLSKSRERNGICHIEILIHAGNGFAPQFESYYVIVGFPTEIASCTERSTHKTFPFHLRAVLRIFEGPHKYFTGIKFSRLVSSLF